MKVFTSIEEAMDAADMFFFKKYSYTQGVYIEHSDGDIVTFASREGESDDEDFVCSVQDGKKRFSANGGEVTVI
jgi:hypothetical protein